MAMPRLTRRVFGAGVLTALGTSRTAVAADEVDLALVLAVDCSYSVDAAEYGLQMRGLARAVASPEVWAAIENGPLQKIAISVFLWSDDVTQAVAVPWTVVSTPQDAQALGRRIAKTRRAVRLGGTGISAALLYAEALMVLAPIATRRVIDVSTDGRNNMGKPVRQARAAVVARGITINGLAITSEWPTLDRYLENEVTGGPSSFVVKADNYTDFAAAMKRKLIREILGPGLT